MSSDWMDFFSSAPRHELPGYTPAEPAEDKAEPKASPLERMREAALSQLASLTTTIDDLKRELETAKKGSKKEKLALTDKIKHLEEALRERCSKLSTLAEKAIKTEGTPNPDLTDLYTRFNNLYEKKMQSLLTENARLVSSLLPFTAEAKMTGQAASAGSTILSQLDTAVVKKNVNSAQQVTLFPDMGVFKKGLNPRATEDEDIALNLLAFWDPEAAVKTWKIKTNSREELLSPEIARHKIPTPKNLTDKELRKIIASEKWEEYELHRKLAKEGSREAYPKFKSFDEEQIYEWAKMQQWSYTPLGGDPSLNIAASLQELHRLNLNGELNIDSVLLVDSDGSKVQPFLSEQEYLKIALDVHIQPTKKIPVNLYPIFKTPAEKQAYERSEKIQMTYIPSDSTDGASKKIGLKELHLLALQGKVELSTLRKLGDDGQPTILSPQERKDISTALYLKWGPLGAELLFLDKSKALKPLGDVQAKPFISDMKLIKSLTPDQKLKILTNMSPESERNAVMTGMLQLMDLHGNNMGVTADGSPNDPEINKEYKKLKDTLVTLPDGSAKAVKDLIMDYLDFKLPPQTVFTYSDPITKQQHTGTLTQLPELEAAFGTNWKLELFDLDKNLGESNLIQKYESEVYLPFRSDLLGTVWARAPFESKTIEKIEESLQRSEEMHAWIRNDHAPIYKQLGQKGTDRVKASLNPIVPTYSRAKTITSQGTDTISNIRKQFASDLTGQEHNAFWQQMEDDLNSAAVASAIKRNKDPATVKKIDLTTWSTVTIDKREAIASQLFPNLTSLQEQALAERENGCKEYLRDYKELRDSTAQGAELIGLLNTYLDKKTNSLTDNRKDELRSELQSLDPNSSQQALKDFKKKIEEESVPSYFNIMKVMYPLLGDTLELMNLIYPSVHSNKLLSDIGNNIDLLIYIDHIKNNPPQPEKALQLANKLEAAINSETHPSYDT
jgi:hypothetical protein